MQKLSKLEATRQWVGEFNAIPSSLLERAFKDDIDSWIELTPIVEGDNVYYNGSYYDVVGVIEDEVLLDMDENQEVDVDDIEQIIIDGETFDIESIDDSTITLLDSETKINIHDVKSVIFNDEVVNVLNFDEDSCIFELDYTKCLVDKSDVNKEYDSWLPMWGTLWTFRENLDEDWARENTDLVAKCGFRIFEDYETGDIYLGIDGAGYSFYEAHWIPLYEARGLKWHSEN